MAATVRIEPAAHAMLSQIAKSKRLSLTEALSRAIEAYRRAVFLDGVAEDFARLRRDRRAWAEESAEREPWSKTTADGLEDEPAYPEVPRRSAARAPKKSRARARRR